jgi:hypothetical protein
MIRVWEEEMRLSYLPIASFRKILVCQFPFLNCEIKHLTEIIEKDIKMPEQILFSFLLFHVVPCNFNLIRELVGLIRKLHVACLFLFG